MKTAFKLGLALLCLAVLALGLAFWTPDTDRDDMIAKYGGSNPTFIQGKNGLTLHIRDQGRRDGDVLILIHGGNGSLHTWEDMVDELSGDFRLISLDMPGHGLTGAHPRRDYGADSMADAVESVLDTLEIDNAIWVGNSYGGWVAWRAALSRPSRVSGLVLISAAGAVTEEPVKPYLAARISASPLGRWIVPYFTPRAIIRSSLKQVIVDDATVTDVLVDRYWELARFPGNRQAVLDRNNVQREDGAWKRIGDIKVPTLILWGKKDVTFPPSFASAFDKKIENSTVKLYPDAAHLAMEEIPVQISADIKAWHDVQFKTAHESLSE